MNECEESALRAAGRKAAIKALFGLRNPHPVGTDKHRLWHQGAINVMQAAVASWEREQGRAPEKDLERPRVEADATWQPHTGELARQD